MAMVELRCAYSTLRRYDDDGGVRVYRGSVFDGRETCRMRSAI